MNGIYDFEEHMPPVLTEAGLRAEAERRRGRWQLVLVALAGLLLQAAAVMIGVEAVRWAPWLSVGCFGYVFCAGVGGVSIAVTYTKLGGAKV